MSKCKIETPNQLPESGLTRVQFKTWRDSIIVYLKQNESFSPFLPGGKYAEWKRYEENPNRIDSLDATDRADIPKPDNEGVAEKKLVKLQKDLLTMLSIIGRKVDQYDYDDVMNESTSLDSILNMIELVYDIGRKSVHFLELSKIKYETGSGDVFTVHKSPQTATAGLPRSGKPVELGCDEEATASSQPWNGRPAWT